MAAPQLDAKSQALATSTGLTVSHTTGSGSNRGMVVSLIIRNAPVTVNSVKYAGVDLVKDVTHRHATDTLQTEVWSLADPPTGANNLVVSLGSSEPHRVIVSTWTADGPFTLDSSNGADGSDATPSVVVTTVIAETVVVDAMIHEAPGGGPSVGAGQTSLFANDESSYETGASYEQPTSAGAKTMSWTSFGSSPDTWSCAAASYGAAGSGPTSMQTIAVAPQRGIGPF